MENSNFSSLIYRIIGKPERWHDDYIDVMHQILDETDSFDDPDNFSELALGDQILSRLKMSNEALAAFSALLDKSRFKMIILDAELRPIYHNNIADKLHRESLALNDAKKLKPALLGQIRKCLKPKSFGSAQIVSEVGDEESQIKSLGHRDSQGNQIYLRPIRNRRTNSDACTDFYLLLVLDQNRKSTKLNTELIDTYRLTDKEQLVLRNLMHGRSISEIAACTFVSENTVKTHLKSLFRKTDTNSQAEVIRLVLTHETQILDSYFTSNVMSNSGPAGLEPDKYLRLNDGFTIAYREYGPADGYPIIVFHNGYGSRLTIPHDYATVCAQGRFRVIIPDRPGFGKTPHSAEPVIAWCDRLNEFISKLRIKEYDVLGNVLGCPLALCYAAKTGPELKRLILSSPVFVNSDSDRQYLSGILAPTARLVHASKRFSKEIYELWLKSVTLNLGTHYRSMLESSVGCAERELFAAHHTVDLMVDGFREGSRKSVDGISSEMVFALAPRKIDLTSITIPVELWWGTEDNRVSRKGVEKLAAALPNSTVRICEGFSEHVYYAKFAQILRGDFAV